MSKIAIYRKQFEYYKAHTESAIVQLDDEHLFKLSAEETNSIAVIMKHIAGNQISRWTNFYTEDGEKSWRKRDNEFIDEFTGRDDLMEYWNKGWQVLFDVLEETEDSDLDTIVYIRNLGCTVHDAMIRQLCHYSYHIGQIVHLAKHFKGKEFQSLSIPKGESEAYNASRFEKEKSLKHFTDDNNPSMK